MSVVILTIVLLSFLCNSKASSMNNNGIMIKNKILKVILLSNRRNLEIFKEVKNLYKICYNKSIDTIIQGVSDYNNLSEDDKLIIEALFSLCY